MQKLDNHKPDPTTPTMLAPQRFGSQLPPLLADEPAASDPGPPQPRRKRRWERVLLAAEIVIIVGVLLVFSDSTRLWMLLRQQLPTDGVNMVTEQVLAAAPGEAQSLAGDFSNLPLGDQSRAVWPSPPAEVPEHLRAWVSPETKGPAVAIPAPVAQAGTRIIIPSIGVDAPIGEGTDWEALKYKVGHHPGTANPGQRGNMVLAAHNDIYGEIFRYLPDVPLGEIITVYAGEQAFRYRIVERRIILPEQTEVMLPTTEPTVTLISCYPYLIDTHRIVLFGELVD